jgi:hypothetical protein
LPPIILLYTIPSPRTLVTTPIFLKKLYPLSPSPPYSLLQSFPRSRALVLSPYPNRNVQRGSLAASTPVDRLSSFPTKHFGATTNNRSAYRAELTAYYLSGPLNFFFIISAESRACITAYVCMCVYVCMRGKLSRPRQEVLTRLHIGVAYWGSKRRSSLAHWLAASHNDVAICPTLWLWAQSLQLKTESTRLAIAISSGCIRSPSIQ